MSDVEAERLRVAECRVAQFEQDARDTAKAKAAFQAQVLVALIGSGVMLMLPKLLSIFH